MKAGKMLVVFVVGVSLVASMGCVSAKAHRQALEAEQQTTLIAMQKADEVKADLTKAQAEVQTLTEEKAALEKQLAGEKKASEALGVQLKKTQTRAMASTAAADAQKAEVEKLTEKIAGLEKQLAEANEKIKALTPAPADVDAPPAEGGMIND